MLQYLKVLIRRFYRPTYARKRIDISWTDLWTFLISFILQLQTTAQTKTAIEQLWVANQTLATFTVRSGFDLYLQACMFPAGSEILVSAVTIPDMITIIKLHDLVPVPVDIEDDGSVSPSAVRALITSKTKALLIAHLFGSRMPLDDIVEITKKHNILLIEDCAEAFCGKHFTGHEEADISMFSFGSIKTATALGGALLTVRDAKCLATMRAIHSTYIPQSEAQFLRRAIKYTFFKILTDSPHLYGLFLATLQHAGKDHHVLIRNWSRSFKPSNLLPQIRKRPSHALLQLLQYRVSHFDPRSLQTRRARITRLAALLPTSAEPVGLGATDHQYWLCPVRVRRPESLVGRLYEAGFDAADGGTSLAVVVVDGKGRAVGAEALMGDVVYLPIDHIYDRREMERLASVVTRHVELYS